MKHSTEYRYEARYRFLEVISLIVFIVGGIGFLVHLWVDDAPVFFQLGGTLIAGGGLILTITHLPGDFAIERREEDLVLVRPGRKPLRLLSHETRARRVNNWGVCTLRVESRFRRAIVAFHDQEIAEGFTRRLKKIGEAASRRRSD